MKKDSHSLKVLKGTQLLLFYVEYMSLFVVTTNKFIIIEIKSCLSVCVHVFIRILCSHFECISWILNYFSESFMSSQLKEENEIKQWDQRVGKQKVKAGTKLLRLFLKWL